MVQLKHCVLGFFIWSLQSSIVECASSSIYRSINSENANILAQQNTSVTPEDVRAIISTLERNTKANLQFLYDANHEDTVRSVANDVFRDLFGLTVFANDGDVETLTTMLDSADFRTVLLAFCSPASLLKIFQMIRQHNLKSHNVGWVLFYNGKEDEVEAIFGLSELIHEGTRVTLMKKDYQEYFTIFSAHVDHMGIIRFHYKGKWNSKAAGDKKQIHKLMTSIDERIYNDMLGRELLVGANEIWPFFFGLKEFNPGGKGKPEGIEPTIVRTLGSILNFTFRGIVAEDRKWGLPYPNGTVTGMIGQAARREAHFSVSFIGVTYPRTNVVEFTAPHYREYVGLFSRSPKPKNRALAVLAPFTLQVWVSIFVSTLAMGPIAYVYNILASKCHKEKTVDDFQDFAFNVFRNIVVQGNRLQTNLPSMRLIFISWYIFCFLISALYSGMLTAVLAIPAYETPIDSLEDLPRAVSEGFDIGLVPETANEYMFRDAKEGIYKQTWELFNHKDMSKSYAATTAKGIQRVLERKYVFIGPKTLSEILATRLNKRNFHFGRSSFYPVGVGMACPLGAPYIDTFSRHVLRMNEGGLVIKWKDDEIRKISLSTSGEEEARSSPFTLTQLQAAFIVVILGFLVASITLVLEKISFRFL